jgi:glyoxylase-like metal-dependent hydrolase (beta-lactamase superfamily II)
MSLTANAWQKVPGSRSLEIFPILAKASLVSCNCFIVSAPAAILVVDPGASAKQTGLINDVVSAALAVSDRPVLLFLTHCHQDHSQEAGRLVLPPGTDLRRLAHESAAVALERCDRALTVAYLYPWHPDICTAPIHCRLFAPDEASEGGGLVFSRGRIDVARTPVSLANVGFAHRSIPLGAGERLEIYHTPGHTGCSISLQLGQLLILGDLPFAANPAVCGLDGWNHTDLISTLHSMEALLASGEIVTCCAGHGYALPAAAMREKLRLMRHDARDLTAVDMMNPSRITGLKRYADELLEEASALFTILAGRLYTASYYLSLLNEEAASEQVPDTIDIDGIDRTLTEFRSFAEAFNESAVPELTVVLKGVQAARSLQQALSNDHVQQVLDPSLVGRAQRRLTDFLCAVRGLQFLNAEAPSSINGVLAQLVARVGPQAEADASELLASLEDRQSFLKLLTRRVAAHSPIGGVSIDFTPTPQSTDAGIASERLDDIVTSLVEGMAAAGATTIQIETEATHHDVLVRLSTLTSVSVEALGERRLALYGRTLGWLGGSLEREESDGSTFVLRVPTLIPEAEQH